MNIFYLGLLQIVGGTQVVLQGIQTVLPTVLLGGLLLALCITVGYGLYRFGRAYPTLVTWIGGGVFLVGEIWALGYAETTGGEAREVVAVLSLCIGVGFLLALGWAWVVTDGPATRADKHMTVWVVGVAAIMLLGSVALLRTDDTHARTAESWLPGNLGGEWGEH